ncbi:fructose-bisphosphate aldolase class I [Candidatus Peregrinibacteria bacterium]|nr:fructose-bisphosphate aldolase class I [Candidatus Peregrinibacteria bacterium]
MDTLLLETTAKAMVAPGKGILAADESSGTCKKRFDSVGVECTEENRRLYRQMLLTTPELGKHVSGVILYDETLRQKTDDGTPFAEILKRNGILPGIKVDTGAHALALFPGEKVTDGLDKLRDRLAEYRKLGARFAKWRAVITIGEDLPTDSCIQANAHALARYAGLCQEADIVPIVEPEVLMDADNTIERCFDVTERTLKIVFATLKEFRIHLPGIVLKPNMVVSGKQCPEQASPEEVAKLTFKCLKATVPAEVPGIAFLSGGQSDVTATLHLNLMNQLGKKPWAMTFSYGRALQDKALKIWAQNIKSSAAGQKALLLRAQCNGAASLGQYTATMEQA